MVAASAETIGIIGLCKDMGIRIGGEVYADSSAALGIAQRSGNGKVRHLRVQALWVQEVRCTRRLAYKKVLGTRNPSDILTKHVAKELLDTHLVTIGVEIKGGEGLIQHPRWTSWNPTPRNGGKNSRSLTIRMSLTILREEVEEEE